MSNHCLSLGAAVIVLTGGVAAPQASVEVASAKVWLGRAVEYESFLKTSEVARVEAIPVGVTKPVRCYFAPGGLLESMAFKTVKTGYQTGIWESYRSEMAAYELDKLLDLQMIPPTVEKRVKGDLGAAVMWVSPVRSFKQMGGPPTPPPEHLDSWNRQIAKAKMFDNLINNRDPNLGNWLVDPAWNLILIDHTRALTTTTNRVHQLTRIDGPLWEKMKGLAEESLTAAAGKWLGKGEIRAVLERRKLMQADIDKLIKENGEDAVVMK